MSKDKSDIDPIYKSYKISSKQYKNLEKKNETNDAYERWSMLTVRVTHQTHTQSQVELQESN